MIQFKSAISEKSDKLHLDKYYTPDYLSEYCILKTFEIISKDKISEIVEPSAGNGSFSDKIDGCIAFDIEPADNSNIVKQDFLSLDLGYKKGRLFIGNPPFGNRNTLAVKFYKQCIKMGDYISFILPISQYKNNSQTYEFDLIWSEDLGKIDFGGRVVHCCLNIYARNPNGINKKPNFKLSDVTVFEYRRCGTYKIPEKYDIGICGWGASVGKEVNFPGQYAQEIYVSVINEEHKNEIIKFLRNLNWKEALSSVSSPKIQAWRVYKILKDTFETLR